ncbi:beta-propeller domain-containing protein [Micromonospora olivasterospora]|uniref:Beta propeller domain-containing protein n=1 Tax=Micromonospora olivasterospora TaxID=1880 RepID=A0A562I9U7_MICOL|nr:beta-propeller domain-containing protein [Micromonospora olivasterospora]TWH67404.1 beta propeller domain-containing protein [Micromonospora olivasterospora]
MTRATVTAAAGTLVALTLLAGSAAGLPHHAAEPPWAPPVGAVRLVSFDSCADALARLRAAAAESVSPWGLVPEAVDLLGGPVPAMGDVRRSRADASAGQAAPAEHSTTNNHEPDADEPDLVKTDGRRIVTVTGGVLRVTDPATRRITGRLDLAAGDDPGLPTNWPAATLLLHGDRALVLVRSAPRIPLVGGRRPVDEGEPGPRLLLVDLTGSPTLVGTYRIDGSLLDARLTGATARVVVRSHPRLVFPYRQEGTDEERLAANRAVIADADLDAWLPAYEWTEGDRRGAGRVGCDRLSATADSTGTSLLTVLSFDLTTGHLGDGDPVSVAADADTVYGTARSLYLAGVRERAGRPWRTGWVPSAGPAATAIYQFDTAAPGRPRYLAAGTVPGTLVNQYALSEWQGRLRVATTSGDSFGPRPATESAVYVLTRRDGTLTRTGAVTGLGRGERIHSVRFLGATGYVVTFRQTDPLYSLDLTNPAAPRVTGELKITGYSAYLHPVGEGRLLGVGQEANDQGRVQGLQVSLFDVADPARPARLARYHVPGAASTVEFDPHAFLYDAGTGLVALPVDNALRLLRLTGSSVAEVGRVAHTGGAPVTRSLLVGGVLWTVSDAGLRASDPAGAAELAWLPTT